MGHRRAIGFGAVGLTLGAVSVCAEDEGSEDMRPTVTLPTITVEAPRPAFDPAFEINAITVLDRETLARSEERDLNGVFRGLPSVSLQKPGSRGTLSTLFVRGASSGLGQLTFDGVPLYGSVNGAFNLSSSPADALERVEIVRGASGPHYGSRALGGVIRLESRDAREHGGFLHLEGGSYGTLSETVGGALRGAKARATITASHDDVFEGISEADARNGNRERDGFRSTQGIARMTLEPTDRLALESSVLYRQSRAEIDVPGPLPGGQIGFVDDLNAFAREETWVAQTTARVQILTGWESRLQLGYTRNRANGEAFHRPFGFDNRLLLGRWTNTQEVHRGAADDPGAPRHLKLVWGGEVQQEEGENAFDLPGLRLHDARTLVSGLLEWQADSGPWAGFLGTSIDHYDDLGTHPTLYAGVSRWATPALKLRASGGRGYRPPAFHELFFVPLGGNPGLVPEQGWSADLGADWVPDEGSRLAITGFYERFDDLIQLTLAPTVSLLVGENVPDTRIWGFEVEGAQDLGHGIATGIDYTYTDARDFDTGNVLPRRPHHQARLYGNGSSPRGS